jgi:hypothetical protein
MYKSSLNVVLVKVKRGIMKKYLIFVSFVMVFVSCDKSNNSTIVTVPIEDDFSSISEPRERWNAYKLTDYIIDVSWACECFPPTGCEAHIIHDTIIDVSYQIPSESYYGRSKDDIYNYTKKKALTINEAFELIEQYKENADTVIVDYDLRFGYPTKLFVDIDFQIADEEIIRRFSNLQKIAN